MSITNQTHHPQRSATGHDLDPNADGDLVLDGLSVAAAQAVVIAVNSVDNNSLSVNVEWVDGSGNVFTTESAADIGLSGVTTDDARLYRKGPNVTATVTSDESAGTQNRVNAFVDAHR
jgi:hypothetical protein